MDSLSAITWPVTLSVLYVSLLGITIRWLFTKLKENTESRKLNAAKQSADHFASLYQEGNTEEERRKSYRKIYAFHMSEYEQDNRILHNK